MEGQTFFCTTEYNFFTAGKYTQAAQDGTSPEVVVKECANLASAKGSTAFWYQEHRDNFKLCAFYNEPFEVLWASRIKHGHGPGSRICMNQPVKFHTISHFFPSITRAVFFWLHFQKNHSTFIIYVTLSQDNMFTSISHTTIATS